ncbi:HNH endonuclease [Paraglaciecola sp.]|uniref:HNH endonuclease n=1 Tax=Paraglaciecola sp. TaxID=1920173 RepID=UPI003EF726F9
MKEQELGCKLKYGVSNPKPLPSQDRLKKVLNYDPITGNLTWKHHANRVDLIGSGCGTKRSDGYYSCHIDGDKFAVHRVIYKLMTNEEPQLVDHINGNPSDNRWCNLRSVTSQENNKNTKLLKNNKTGIAGVFYHEKQHRYHANVRINGKSLHLGSYADIEKAKFARSIADKVLGFSKRHGKAA